MITLTFKKEFNAPIQKVWDVLWNKDTYSQWTSAFSGSSTMEGTLRQGEKILFLDNKGNGMVVKVETMNEPHELVFKVLGEMQNGDEKISENEESGYEKYYLSEADGKTILTVSLNTSEEYREHMENGFNKGLDIAGEIAEK